MKRFSCSGSLALMLASITAASIFLSPAAVRSQTPEWVVFTAENSGLPSIHVNALAIDAQGNVWIGRSYVVSSWGGTSYWSCELTKFDGTNWTVYTPDNSGLPEGLIAGLAIDVQGNVWVGTENSGLGRFDGVNWTVYNEDNSGLPDVTVYDLAVDAQGSLWIGTFNGGLAKFDGTNWTVYDEDNSVLPGNTTTPLAIDNQGNVWIGTGGGVFKLRGEMWTVYDSSNSELPDNSIPWGALAIDARGNLWIGTYRGGLAVYREGGVILPNIPTGVEETRSTEVPSTFSLSQNHPNPFNPETTLQYNLAETGTVRLSIYALTGQYIRTLVNEERPAGSHSVVWDGTDDTGRYAATGVYVCRMEAGDYRAVRKLVLVR